MRTLMLSTICSAALLAGCQEKGSSEETPAPPASAPAEATSAIDKAGGEIMLTAFKNTEVEVGCGMCVYEMEGVDHCETAAMVNGNPVLIRGAGEGTHICSGSRRAVVSGAMEDGTLVATSFDLKN